jgi:hypothetical protein
MSLRTRLVWLLACVAAGSAIGAAGWMLSGDSAWFAAIPAVLAAGWLFLADPTQCEAPRRHAGGRDGDAKP